MWILSFLPDWVIHLVFAIGLIGTIVGFLLGSIPFINRYLIPFRIISVAVLAIGLYLEGGIANENKWQERIKELEAKLAKAEAASSNKNVEIQEKIVEKTQIIREKGQKQIEFLTRIEKGEPVIIEKDISAEERQKLLTQIEELRKFNETCTIPTLIIDEHNKAATKPVEVKK